MNKLTKILFLLALFTYSHNLSAQATIQELEYEVNAQGMDSPFNDAALVCYNKFFNLDNMSSAFRQKYKLDGLPARKKMLVEIFLGDKSKGMDKISINSIRETANELLITTSLILTPRMMKMERILFSLFKRRKHENQLPL